ncbi:MAG: DUF58 domain-containing protein, partial [Actinomycetota bacterium]|nr:DUF58 domain-containing protein [Actinomycetota bacterium]
TEPVRWRGAGRGRRLSSPEAQSSADALAAVDLDGLRPYRSGTSASRIHWPALARGAGLLERRLSVDGDARPLVVLDAREPGRQSPLAVERLDAAVRAAASLTLELARTGGCGLLLPGEHRPTTVDRELIAWPAAHARLAVVSSAGARAPALGPAGSRLGAVVYVAVHAPERLAALSTEAGRGPVVLVLPTASLADGHPRGIRGPAMAALDVCGCRGFVLGARREPPRVRASRTALR